LAARFTAAMVSTGRRNVIRPRFCFPFGGRPLGLPGMTLFIARTKEQSNNIRVYNRLLCVQNCR
jgi:hypothetical protein